ncbi:MAG: aa3-type cytochrome c oxidase subunit IV [Hyphomonadaceae bacterium]|nr:aa3-type cytochrome c oxidase subunit IV [Hyphomonadaceae bacterium]
MDMPAHRGMFAGFIKAVEWSCAFIAMLLALTVFSFAMGLGWWTGLIAWVVVGVAAGALLGLGAVWWALLGVSTVLLAAGGAVTMALIGAG